MVTYPDMSVLFPNKSVFPPVLCCLASLSELGLWPCRAFCRMEDRIRMLSLGALLCSDVQVTMCRSPNS